MIIKFKNPFGGDFCCKQKRCILFSLLVILVWTFIIKLETKEPFLPRPIGAENGSLYFPYTRTHTRQCTAFGSFNLSKAIMSDILVQRTSSKHLTKMYTSPVEIMDVIKNISNEFGLNDLPTPKMGGSCVIVSSGGILLQFDKMGQLIDSYDYVIRLNLAPTKNFEAFVGTKTSLMFGYWNSLKKGSETGREANNTHFVYGGMQDFEFSKLLALLRSDEETKLRSMFETSKLSMFSQYTMSWIQKTFWRGKKKKQRPSTGLQALLIMANWCPTPLDFAGFGFVHNDSIPYHYFDEAMVFTSVHTPSKELALIRQMKKCQIIGKDLTHSLGR